MKIEREKRSIKVNNHDPNKENNDKLSTKYDVYHHLIPSFPNSTLQHSTNQLPTHNTVFPIVFQIMSIFGIMNFEIYATPQECPINV